MADIQMVDAVDIDFFARDLYLINKNALEFTGLVTFYSEKSLEDVMCEFARLGNKMIKTKQMKLKYLACYQSILNHKELFPSKGEILDIIKERLGGEGVKIELVETNQNGEEEVIVLENNEENSENEAREEDLSFTIRNRDLQYKWSRILDRCNQINEYVRDQIEESIDEHSQNLELDDNQNQLSNEEKEYVPSENGFDAESTFYA